MAEALGTSSVGGTSKEREGPIYVKELGLTQIDGLPEDHPFIADVIFVHGLQGHPRRTWQSKSNAESSTRPRKRFRPFSWKDTEVIAHDDPTPFWPADILSQDLKDVRILTFGYDSKVTKGFMALTSKNGIFQHGNSFLRAVGRARIGHRQRPIVFVAHSLGGLVVKQALIEARKQTHEPDLLDIYDSTHAIIFFGTPHRGSDLASWGLMLSTIAEAVQLDTNNAVLRDLDPTSGSSKLEEMRLDFDDILRDGHRSKELRVYSFQEEEGMTSIKWLGGKVRSCAKIPSRRVVMQSDSRSGISPDIQVISVGGPFYWLSKPICLARHAHVRKRLERGSSSTPDQLSKCSPILLFLCTARAFKPNELMHVVLGV